jgi:hypothetical protein
VFLGRFRDQARAELHGTGASLPAEPRACEGRRVM